jgi:hypothetical protein
MPRTIPSAPRTVERGRSDRVIRRFDDRGGLGEPFVLGADLVSEPPTVPQGSCDPAEHDQRDERHEPNRRQRLKLPAGQPLRDQQRRRHQDHEAEDEQVEAAEPRPEMARAHGPSIGDR